MWMSGCSTFFCLTTMTLYYKILLLLNDPEADLVKQEFRPQIDAGHFMARFETASPELKRQAVRMCVDLVVGQEKKGDGRLREALSILARIANRAHLRAYIIEHLSLLEEYLLRPTNLEMWCLHTRGKFTKPSEVRRDAAVPLLLESLLRTLGSERTASAREYIAQHAADPVLRERILKNAEEGL